MSTGWAIIISHKFKASLETYISFLVMLSLSYNLVNNNEYFNSEHFYGVSAVLFVYSRGISSSN